MSLVFRSLASRHVARKHRPSSGTLGRAAGWARSTQSMSASVKAEVRELRPDRDGLHQMRDGSLYGTLVDMIKETIPALRKLSNADRFALAVELWDELSSNPDEIPLSEEQGDR